MLYLANQGVDIVRLDDSSLYLEAAWNKLPQPATGSHNRTYDAYDLRDRVPGCTSSWRGCYVYLKSSTFIWNC